MGKRSAKNYAKVLGMRQSIDVVKPNDQWGKRQRFEAMQKLIKPKKEEKSSE